MLSYERDNEEMRENREEGMVKIYTVPAKVTDTVKILRSRHR